MHDAFQSEDQDYIKRTRSNVTRVERMGGLHLEICEVAGAGCGHLRSIHSEEENSTQQSCDDQG